MGYVWSSCCHRRARLSLAEKALNLAAGFTTPLRGIGLEGSSAEEDLARLQFCRKKMLDSSKSIYLKLVKGEWTVGDEMLPRPKDAVDSDGPVRVLVHAPVSKGSNLPLVLYAHGGGMTIGGPEEGAGAYIFREVAAKSTGQKFCWASLGYRLAPEAKFPKAVDDMVHAFAALQDPALAEKYGYDPQRIGIAGTSAGGFLAGHAALRLARAAVAGSGLAPAFLVLVCPAADPAMQESESWRVFGDLPMCPASWGRWSWRQQLAEDGEEEISKARQREASLLEADWSPCRGLPVLNNVATFDIVRDEGLELTKAIASGGAEVQEVVARGSHGIGLALDAAAKEKHVSWWCRVLSARGRARDPQKIAVSL